MSARLPGLAMVTVVAFACGGPAGPEGEAPCGDWAIYYDRHGGWTETAVLEADSTGLVTGYRVAHASLDTLSAARTRLGPDEQDHMINLFHGFDRYAPYYEPKEWLTDGDLHRLVLTCSGRSDTVRVYEPERAEIPKGLARILGEVESLWGDLMFPRD